jgi:predicted enzyme related to lactoylglutathione lyase
MSEVNGIGGVFLYSNEPEKLAEWYTHHLGIEFSHNEAGTSYWMEFFYRDDNNPSRRASTVYAINMAKKPLSSERGGCIINYRVDNLEAFIAQLKAKGVSVEPLKDDGENGWFTWITDPEGNRIELYQPY